MSTDPVSGERHLRHNMSADGFYKGRLVKDLKKKSKESKGNGNLDGFFVLISWSRISIYWNVQRHFEEFDEFQENLSTAEEFYERFKKYYFQEDPRLNDTYYTTTFNGDEFFAFSGVEK